jgi:putative oxidoreductase
MFHGGIKLFGWFGKNSAELMSLISLAGIIEFFGGILIFLGLFTSITAVLTAITMIGAWAKVHINQGINPMTNGGELSMLFFAAFLVLIAYGAGKYSLERLIWEKEYMH